jgi:hypothetical protein
MLVHTFEDLDEYTLPNECIILYHVSTMLSFTNRKLTHSRIENATFAQNIFFEFALL